MLVSSNLDSDLLYCIKIVIFNHIYLYKFKENSMLKYDLSNPIWNIVFEKIKILKEQKKLY